MQFDLFAYGRAQARTMAQYMQDMYLGSLCQEALSPEAVASIAGSGSLFTEDPDLQERGTRSLRVQVDTSRGQGAFLVTQESKYDYPNLNCSTLIINEWIAETDKSSYDKGTSERESGLSQTDRKRIESGVLPTTDVAETKQPGAIVTEELDTPKFTATRKSALQKPPKLHMFPKASRDPGINLIRKAYRQWRSLSQTFQEKSPSNVPKEVYGMFYKAPLLVVLIIKCLAL